MTAINSPYPNHLSTNNPTFTIAQISDLHLSDQASKDSFLAVLELAKKDKPDLLLLTGDLVNDGDKVLYDWLFAVLTDTNIAFLCLAGNHDVTQEIGHHLPFHERQFLPIACDDRLVKQHKLTIHTANGDWQLLCVHSAVDGQIFGKLEAASLQFLQQHLHTNTPTIIAMHHHPHPVGSAWIDGHILQNPEELWATLAPHHNIALLCGHVHQAHTLHVHGHILHTCPATSRQFLPHHDDFAIDPISAGFRLIRLDGTKIDTQIRRI